MKEQLPWGPAGPFGTWTVEGTTAAGESYDGELHIGRVNGTGDALSATWKTSMGPLSGLGLLHNGRLLLARIVGEVPSAEAPGIVWYTLTGTGDFDAVWSSGGLDGLIGTGLARGGTPGCLTGSRKILYSGSDGNALPPSSISMSSPREMRFG